MRYVSCLTVNNSVLYVCRTLVNGRWVELTADNETDFYSLLSGFFNDNEILEKTDTTITIGEITLCDLTT